MVLETCESRWKTIYEKVAILKVLEWEYEILGVFSTLNSSRFPDFHDHVRQVPEEYHKNDGI